MVIILVGGGTGGSVSPLLAVSGHIKQVHPKAKFFFLGPATGPQIAMAKQAGVPFIPIAAGKLRRYFSLGNLLTPFQVAVAFFQALRLLKGLKASVVFGAGSFAQVPVAWAAWVLGIPVVLHQQDVRPTLSNKLCAPIAKKITVTFEKSLYDFPQSFSLSRTNTASKLEWTGNPCLSRTTGISREQALAHFGLDKTLPTVLVMGGGSGAGYINSLVSGAKEDLLKIVNVIHITGKGKGAQAREAHYFATEFLLEMDIAYKASDLVISRAGLSTITELAALGKPSVIIPIPATHQEDNAGLLDAVSAAFVVPQKNITKQNFATGIRQLLFNNKALRTLSENIVRIMPQHATQKVSRVLLQVLK